MPLGKTASSSIGSQVCLRDIYAARRRIAGVVRRTPLFESPALAAMQGGPVYLKAENLQETGSFKVRGAANRVLCLSAEERARGILAVSTGNHGRAVAFVARMLGISATICVAKEAVPYKVAAMRELGAEILLYGDSYDEAAEYAARLQQERGLVMIEPFDDPLVVAGQGTIGLELLEELPGLRLAVVPLSGGGLIAGIALALKSADPSIRVVGVSQDRAPVMYHSLLAGHPIHLPEEPTLADALVGGLGVDNHYTFQLVRQYVDDVVLVSEEEIVAAMALALEKQHLVVEGGGAVGLAAVQAGKVQSGGEMTAVVISGGNVDIGQRIKVWGKGESASRRSGD